MNKWNEQQTKAIYAKDTNILISASAGSGKTSVLIARIMHLIIDEQIPLEKICAMTFTDAAANEMKKRLAQELSQQVATSQDPQQIKILNEQIIALPQAMITTIHGFCLSIIKEYYYMLNINPIRLNNILDDASKDGLLKQTLSNVIDTAITNKNPDFELFYDCYSNLSTPLTSINEIIIKLANLTLSKSDRSAFLNQCVSNYSNIKMFEDINDLWTSNFFASILLKVQNIKKKVLVLIETYQQDFNNNEKKAKSIQLKLSYLELCISDLSARNYDSFSLNLEKMVAVQIPTAFDSDDKFYNDTRTSATSIENNLLEINFSSSELVADISKSLPFVKLLTQLTNQFLSEYNRAKEELNVIDFDDMEYFASKVLCDYPEIALRYQQRFDTVMVDEFQDSNDVQDTIIKQISRSNNVFRVGDLKQSIYGFRHATPQIMQSYMDNDPSQTLIYLSNNYRSQQNIVEFNNILFQKLMNIEGINSRYEARDQAYIGLDSQKSISSPITFHAILNNTLAEKSHLHISKNEWKAKYLAFLIKSQQQKENRSWSDFTVLIRSNSRKDLLKKAFVAADIPYYINITTGFYDSFAIQCLLNTLYSLADQSNEIALIGCLTSPLFELTWNDIATIKQAKGPQTFFEYLKTNNHPCFSQYGELLSITNSLSLSELVMYIYHINNYYETKTSLQDKYNLDLLLMKAQQFEQTHGTSIDAFITHLENIDQQKVSEASSSNEENDVVKIMSIHQSKGLQFPVVYIFSTSEFNTNDNSSFFISDSEQGIAFKAIDLPERYVRNTLPHIAIEHALLKNFIEEEMRILYVATTRAKEQLHFIDCVADETGIKQPFEPHSVFELNGYSSWLLPCMNEMKTTLCNISVVDEMFELSSTQETVSNHKINMRYQDEPLLTSIVTPSSFAHSNLPTTFESTNSGSDYGNTLHKMMENLNFESLDTIDLKVEAKQLNLVLSNKQEEQLIALINTDWFKTTIKYPHYREIAIYGTQGSQVIHGFIDYLVVLEKEVMIIDYKSDNLKDSQSFVKRYYEQLALYKQAITKQYPNHVINTFVYAFYLNSLIPIE